MCYFSRSGGAPERCSVPLRKAILGESSMAMRGLWDIYRAPSGPSLHQDTQEQALHSYTFTNHTKAIRAPFVVRLSHVAVTLVFCVFGCCFITLVLRSTPLSCCSLEFQLPCTFVRLQEIPICGDPCDEIYLIRKTVVLS